MKIDANKLAAALLISLMLFIFCQPTAPRAVEDYVRSRVVQLEGNGYACSGVQVRSPRGKDYIVSAGHCAELIKDGSVWAQLDTGRAIPRKALEESVSSDLLLLEGMPNLQGLSVADSLHTVQHIITLTHGRRLPTYKTEGEVLGDFNQLIPFEPILSEEDKKACEAKPKQKVITGFFGEECALAVRETLTTALVQPGSSGGPVINVNGELVGIVSAGGDFLSGLVMLSDIKAFLAPY